MSTVAIALIALALLCVFIVAQIPIWIGLSFAGMAGLIMLMGFTPAMSALGTAAYGMVSNYSLLVIPMFILMGVMIANSGVAHDIYTVARKAASRLPGGLGVGTILAAGGFSAVTGSSGATVATVGRVSVNEMIRSGYRPNASAAIVAAGGTLGVLIPPSIILVVYGSLTSTSIGALLISAVIPGILTIGVYAGTVVVLYKLGYLTVGGREARSTSPTEILTLTKRNVAGTLYVLLLFAIVVGGIFTGIVTVTEAGAVAAAVALAMMVVRHAKGGLRTVAAKLGEAVAEAASMTSMIFALLIGGSIFSYFLVSSGIPSSIAASVRNADLNTYALLAVALLIMLVLGFFLDSLAILIIAIPLMYPIVAADGIDAIWFGILAVKAIEIGLLTPPFGINVYVALGTSKKTTLEGIFKNVVPFIVAEVLIIGLIMLFPQIVTGLPALMSG